MVTPELISYIKGEFGKGKTREMIRATLVSEGGWSEVDLNDAFRTAIPMQSSPVQNPIMQSNSMQNNVVKNSFTQSNLMKDSAIHSTFQSSVTAKSSSPKLHKMLLIILLILVVGGAGALWYFRPLLITNTIDSISYSLFTPPVVNEENVVPPVVDNITTIPEDSIPVASLVKDCGTSASPDLKNSKTYKDNAVLNCLGNSALICEDAKAILTNTLFPEVLQIVKDQNTNTCSFKLSYTADSTLTDANGNNLAGQYVSCPLSVVKAVDETKPNTPTYKAPTLTDVNKYASQIYFYGTIGLFMENGVDVNKIQNAGCSGPYINSVVLSFQKTQ